MMKSFKNRASSTNFKVESKYILKLKELIRNFRQKKAFYLDHSKFATYVDPEYLSIFKEELIDFSKAWIRGIKLAYDVIPILAKIVCSFSNWTRSMVKKEPFLIDSTICFIDSAS